MPGDPGAIRALAHRLRTQAEDVRREADRLVARLDSIGLSARPSGWRQNTMACTGIDSPPWTGRAAGAARTRGRERAGALRRTAALHDDAADALDRHAREVERRQELIARVERVVTGLVAEAADRLVDGAVGPPLPLPGSRDWLDVDVHAVAESLGLAA